MVKFFSLPQRRQLSDHPNAPPCFSECGDSKCLGNGCHKQIIFTLPYLDGQTEMKKMGTDYSCVRRERSMLNSLER